jgi:hypothetical protein
MARQSDLLIELQRQLRLLDDAALSVLASPGLLRRARKDLETLSPSWTGEGDAIQVDLGTHRVVFDRRGPAQARCSCPARTACQHLLAAILYLAKVAPEPSDGAFSTAEKPGAATSAILHDQLMAFAPGALIKFAGKPALREALRIATKGDPAQITSDSAIAIRLAHPAVEFRYAGGGLEGFITDYRGRHRGRLVVAAVIAYQVAHGRAVPTIPGDEARSADADTATAHVASLRQTLIPKAVRLVCETIETGLAHLSESFVERFAALSTVAEGARLHRLSLALARLADGIDLQLERNAMADQAALFDDLARTYALASALCAPEAFSRIDLVGEVRSAYQEAPSLRLFCAGAFPWRTASGYVGVTVLFWSVDERRWLSVGESRPVGTIGFDPAASYREPGPWTGCNSPAAIAGKHLTLSRIGVNRPGRLSGSSTASAVVSGETAPDFGAFAYRRWNTIPAQSRSRDDGIGLAERDPHRDYVVLLPTRYGTRSFEPVSQDFIWPLRDEAGDTLLLRLRFSDLSAHAIARLEGASPSEIAGIVGQFEPSRLGRTVRPLALLTHNSESRVDNVFFDSAAKKSGFAQLTSRLHDVAAAAASRALAEQAAPRGLNTTEKLLDAFDAELLRMAERGTIAVGQSLAALAQQLAKLAEAGLTLEVAADSNSANPEQTASRLLGLRHCSRTARQLLHDL